MKIVSIVIDVFFGLAWMGLGIMALCGEVMPPATVACGFGIAGLHYIWDAIDKSCRANKD